MSIFDIAGCLVHRFSSFPGFVAAIMLLGAASAHAESMGDADDLANLSLEELLATEITTLSRKAENLGGAPAAVFVISQSDIRRSGARSIPELLRIVPGMQVAQIDGNKWAVTARGANGRFANKLLVLMDGRTLYTPMLGGVYWDVQDTDIAAIERIEVIRGPGATMWGSNAVNGVVNIITKHAADTQGGNLSVSGGQGGVESVLRFGATNDDFAYRAFAKVLDRDGNVSLAGDDIGDDTDMVRFGGRIDWDRKNGDELTVSGEAYAGTSGEYRISRSVTPPYEVINERETDVSGVFALARWSRNIDDDSQIEARVYFDSYDREAPTYDEKIATIDFDVQHRFRLGDRHDLVWGVNFRRSDSQTEGTFEISLDPADRTQNLVSAFIQDDISVFGDKARLMIGSKFENNNLSDRNIEVEPSVRLATDFGENGTIWVAASHAVRMPSRGELDGRVVSAVLPPGQPSFPLPVPLVPTANGDGSMKSEEVTTYELGYRMRNDALFVDVALFYNDFDDLRSLTPAAPICAPSGDILQINPACLATATHVEAPLIIQNDFRTETAGVELAVSRQVSEWWRLQGGYTYFHIVNESAGVLAGLAVQEDSPDHQVSLRSSMDLRQNFELDIWLRWVDDLEGQQIDAYTAMDLRFAWSPKPALMIAAGGRNLLAGDHMEFMSELVDLAPVQIEPEAYIDIRWSF